MSRYVQHLSFKQTPQSEPIPGREKEMKENNAGGYSFTLDCWKQLDRFLILGCEGGSYYVNERNMTKDNATCVIKCIDNDPVKVVDKIVEISDRGRAPKNDPAIFALGLCLSDKRSRARAIEAIPKVCRIGTHILQLVSVLSNLPGFNRSVKRGVGNWYVNQTIENLQMNLIKYQNRHGFTNKDVLNITHPITDKEGHKNCFAYLTEKTWSGLPLIEAFEKAKKASEKETIQLIKEFNLPREAINTEHLNSPVVWEALLERMPMTAMIRNLNKMTAVGLIKPMSNALGKIVTELSNKERLNRSRIHPIAVLAAMKTYAQGHGERGKLSWTPVTQVIDALDDAFYASFDNVQPTGKRWLLGCDISGSMDMGAVSGVPGLTPRVAVGAMSMVIARTEPMYHIIGFTSGSDWGRTGITQINISPKSRLDDVCNTMARLPMGGTDCSLPMIYALQNKIPVDAFVVMTDNETWAGNIQPVQALQNYRNKMGIDSKLIVMGMTATNVTIADPKDAGMLDVVGFDAAVPTIMSEFMSGNV